MELLLWLWFYDTRWFFNIKVNVMCYKNVWIIPLFLHIFLMVVCLYYLNISETFTCDKSLRLWLYSRTFFSFLISINIVTFMIKVSNVHKKETSYFDNAKKIYPALKNNMKQYDYWIRRKSLFSTPGILLIILGIVSLFWSYLIISFYHFQNYYFNCDVKIQKILTVHSFFILIGNIPLTIIILILLFIKIGSFLSAFACPGFLIWIVKCCSPEHPTLDVVKYSV